MLSHHNKMQTTFHRPSTLSLDEQNMKQDHELLSLARDAQTRAYAPYSHFPVGAVLVTADNQTITGGNVENASYGATICAERSALVAAVAKGAMTGPLRTVVVAGGIEEPASPCGMCLQMLAEFSDKNTEVLCVSQNGTERRGLLIDFIAHPFGLGAAFGHEKGIQPFEAQTREETS